MKYVYITALTDFQIKERLLTPLRIKENLYISNNPAHIAGYMTPSDLITIGSLEARPLTDGTAVLYRIDEISIPTEADTEIVNFLREVQAFLTATWLVEDNSANCELAFSFAQSQGHVHSNSLALHYTSCKGERSPVILHLEKLQKIGHLHAEFLQGAREQEKQPHTKFRKNMGRLDRGMAYLQQARANTDLGQKIANYCSFFESTLSTSSSELSHQLAERTAFFVGQAPDERLEIFQQIKQAYGIRSKIVHGDTLTEKIIVNLPEISKNCDDHARKLVLKIVQDEKLDKLFQKGSSESLDKYMLSLIFGTPQDLCD